MIPAFNEAASIAECVRSHILIGRELASSLEVLVLDDGSTDGTSSVLEKLSRQEPELRVLHHSQNRGVGRSLLDLYTAARGSWVYFNAADGQIPAAELRKMWAVRQGKGLVVGWRRPRRDPFVRLAMSRFYAIAIRSLFAVRIHDIDSVKLYDSAALRDAWPTTESSFAEAEILIRLVDRGYAVTETKIAHLPRRAGRAKGGNWRIVVHALWDFTRFLVRVRLRRLFGKSSP